VGSGVPAQAAADSSPRRQPHQGASQAPLALISPEELPALHMMERVLQGLSTRGISNVRMLSSLSLFISIPQAGCKSAQASGASSEEKYTHETRRGQVNMHQGQEDIYTESAYMYLEKPLQKYLDELASAQPTPGGGSAAALSGALGASLACMVARLTLGRADYTTVQLEIEALVERIEALRTRFQELMQEDIEAYGRLSAAFKLPRTTSEEKVARTKAIQGQLVEAALVPLEVVERAVELVQCCLRIAAIGNVNVLSDIATGTALASSAGTGAAWMVRTNLHALKDQEQVQKLNSRLSAALDTIAADSQQVIDTVGERV